MKRVTIQLPNALYQELAELAAKFEEPEFGPVRCAQEILTAELAARRLPKVTRGRYGARPASSFEAASYRLALPEMESFT